jgi:methylenetetrahydrofolate reductase (NADPH)
MRVAAARGARELGFVPLPHISARRLASEEALGEFLEALEEASHASEHVFVIAGDPEEPERPYEDALSVIQSGLLERHRVRRVSIAGYPEGHPAIAGPVLWSSLVAKAKILSEHGLTGDIITQFGFDVDAVIGWIEAVVSTGSRSPSESESRGRQVSGGYWLTPSGSGLRAARRSPRSTGCR